jgi:hypothetical protein
MVPSTTVPMAALPVSFLPETLLFALLLKTDTASLEVSSSLVTLHASPAPVTLQLHALTATPAWYWLAVAVKHVATPTPSHVSLETRLSHSLVYRALRLVL